MGRSFKRGADLGRTDPELREHPRDHPGLGTDDAEQQVLVGERAIPSSCGLVQRSFDAVETG